ncbi:MAG: hypothetical protein AMXMBFR33_54830 [Candidatus Xenobia bacterium]
MSESPAQRETPSPVFDELLRLVRGAQGGKVPRPQLQQFVEQLTPRFVQAREATRQQIVGQGAEHVERFAEPIARIEEAFQEVESALQAVLKFARSGDEQDGLVAVRWVIRAAWNQATAMDAYQQAELAAGPSRMPLVNLMVKMKEGFLAGTTSRTEFEDAVRGAMNMCQEAQQEMRAKGELSDAEDAMVGAYERLKKMLGELLGAIGQGGERLEAALTDVTDASETVRAAMEELNTRIFTAGPTKMPHANLVLNIMAAHQAGQVPDQVLLNALEVFRRGMEHESGEVERMLSLPTRSSAIQEQAQKTRQAYDLHWPAIDLAESYAAGQAEQYEPGRQALIQASEALAACKEAFEQIGELEGKVLCVKCGAANAPGDRACSKCGARMVQTELGTSTMSLQEGGEAQGGELVMTENLLRVFQAVNEVAEQTLELEEFGEVLDWMAELVQQHLLGVPQAPAFSREGMNEEQSQVVGELEEELARQREEVVGGAEELMAGLNRLSCYLDEQDKEHLTSGVRMVRDGAVRVQRAQRAIDEVAANVESARRGDGPTEEEQEDEQVA